jgi:orotate phosphoribosyltransferase
MIGGLTAPLKKQIAPSSSACRAPIRTLDSLVLYIPGFREVQAMVGERALRTGDDVTPETVSPASLAKALLEMKAIRFGDFTLPNGRRSLYDIDLRLVPSFPDIYTTVLAAYVELVTRIREESFDAIAGVATGVTISSPMAVMLKKPMMYVRKQGESRGANNKMVEGISTPGSKVLLIDDLVSSGASIVSSSIALRDAGYKIEDAAVLIDRKEGGEMELAKSGVKLHSFTTTRELFSALLESNMVQRSTVESILSVLE